MWRAVVCVGQQSKAKGKQLQVTGMFYLTESRSYCFKGMYFLIRFLIYLLLLIVFHCLLFFVPYCLLIQVSEYLNFVK